MGLKRLRKDDNTVYAGANWRSGRRIVLMTLWTHWTEFLYPMIAQLKVSCPWCVLTVNLCWSSSLPISHGHSWTPNPTSSNASHLTNCIPYKPSPNSPIKSLLKFPPTSQTDTPTRSTSYHWSRSTFPRSTSFTLHVRLPCPCRLSRCSISETID